MTKEIAQTIMQQIKSIDSRAFMAWGSKEYQITKEGLQFKVGGLAKFKGLVHVKYNRGNDMYDIDFAKVRKGEYIVVTNIDNVFADQLVDCIDSVVQ